MKTGSETSGQDLAEMRSTLPVLSSGKIFLYFFTFNSIQP